MHKVSVDLKNIGYDIIIEKDFSGTLRDFLVTKRFSSKVLIISDTHVADLYGGEVLQCVEFAGMQGEIFAVDAGESAKSLAVAEKLYTKAISLGLDRNSLVIALGGGVVGDLAGFIAATFLRGVPFIQIPTSLLAQVDSSVGGKVAINHQLGKNLIGAFYQPKIVAISLDTLTTLPPREIYTGLAEVIKYGIICDKEFFDYLATSADKILQLDGVAMEKIISRSCEIKAAVVSEDEKETGRRIILNFGHTIAHAIENATGYTRYNHGEAVAIGMYGAALLSYYSKLITKETVKRIKDIIEKFNLPTKAQGCTAEQLFDLLLRDKKVISGKVQWVLLKDIGEVFVNKDVEEALVQLVLNEITV